MQKLLRMCSCCCWSNLTSGSQKWYRPPICIPHSFIDAAAVISPMSWITREPTFIGDSQFCCLIACSFLCWFDICCFCCLSVVYSLFNMCLLIRFRLCSLSISLSFFIPLCMFNKIIFVPEEGSKERTCNPIQESTQQNNLWKIGW